MTICPEALELLSQAIGRAQGAELREPLAMMLATADALGRPSARVVLLRRWDENGFGFFSNYESHKADQLAVNARVALCLYWDPLHEQVRVEGVAAKASPQESDEYWNARHRGSQIGAWASQQSRELSSREELERRVAEVEVRYAGQPVPRPPFWGGYRVVPDRIEFWTGRDRRLHDRIVFQLRGQQWSKYRLFP